MPRQSRLAVAQCLQLETPTWPIWNTAFITNLAPRWLSVTGKGKARSRCASSVTPNWNDFCRSWACKWIDPAPAGKVSEVAGGGSFQHNVETHQAGIISYGSFGIEV